MSDETQNVNATNTNEVPMEDFGVGAETVSKSRVNFEGGFTKAFLTHVKAQEVGKTENKFFVLNFFFKDVEGIKSFTHTEFIPRGQSNQKETEAENYAVRKNRFNARIKHIYEAFAPFPVEGLGKGAKSWNEVFEKIAEGFNGVGENAIPIYQTMNGDKKMAIQVWTKCTYDNKNNIQFPMMPNFIERLTPANQDKPKSLQIDKKWDKVSQIETAPANNAMGGSQNGINTGNDSTMGF